MKTIRNAVLLIAATLVFIVLVLLADGAYCQMITKTITLQGVHAAPVVRTKDSATVYVKGSAVVDIRSVGFTKYKWRQVYGAPCRIERPDSLASKIFGLKKGTYRFSFTVTDTKHFLKSTAYTSIVVK